MHDGILSKKITVSLIAVLIFYHCGTTWKMERWEKHGAKQSFNN